MILDLDRRFLFMKSTKTAGTSVEIWLSAYCGPNAVITPTVDEDLREKHFGRPPQNFRVHDVSAFPGGDLKVFDVQPWGAVHFFNHMSLDQVISQLGDGFFETLYSFGFTRNPFVRAVSAYTWLAGCNPLYYGALTLKEHRVHFRNMLTSSFESTEKWLRSSSRDLEVKHIFRYEDFSVARREIHKALFIDCDTRPLPNAKSGFSDILGFPREELINKEERGLIESICAWEFSRFYA